MMPGAFQLGAVPVDEAATRFTVWAPHHERLRIRFPDDGRSEAMTPEQDGYHTSVTFAPVGTRYLFELSNGNLRPDPCSLGQPEGVHGPSIVLPRPRSVSGFRCAPLHEHVLYELHVGTFTQEGTFDAIIPRLDALAELGITAIELMPVAQFPGERNWGYDGVLPFAAQWSYGGLPGLLRLVDACHARGLAVILDVVYNHLGPEGNYLSEFGPYFTDRYKTPWGAALNFDGPQSDHVREYFIQSSLLWTRDCGIDGLRLDAVQAIVDRTARTFIEELAARNHDAAAASGRRVLLIAESNDNDPRLVRDRIRGGVGLDGCWNDDFHHAVRTALTGDRRGHFASYGEPSQIARAVRDRYVFTGQYARAFGRRHGAPADDVEHGRLVVYTQNHDQVGNQPRGERLDRVAGLDGARVAAALVLLSPFTPLLWMGEEYADPAPFFYFVSHSDPDLIEAVRRGRARDFAEFFESGEAPDPQSEMAFLDSKLCWSAREGGVHALMLDYYRELLRIRRACRLGHRGREAVSGEDGALVWIDYKADPRLLIVANTGSSPAPIPWPRIDARSLRLVLDSSARRWGGGTASENRSASIGQAGARTALVFAEVPGS